MRVAALDGRGDDPVEEGARRVNGLQLKSRPSKDLFPLVRCTLLRAAKDRHHLNVNVIHDGRNPHNVVVGQCALADHERGVLGGAHGGTDVLEDCGHFGG